MNIYSRMVEALGKGRRCALATVLSVKGSVPQVPGTKLLVDEEGAAWGTIGGGLVEAEAKKRAFDACVSGIGSVFESHMDHAYARDAEAICGGRMRVLIQPLSIDDASIWSAVAGAVDARERGVLFTTFHCQDGFSAVSHWQREDALVPVANGPSVSELRRCIDRETTALFSPGDPALGTEVLVQPLLPAPRLVIVGAGHVGLALARLGVTIGFDVLALDDRPEYADPALFPAEATVVCEDIPSFMKSYPYAKDVYVVLVTRGHRCDAEALEVCIHQPCAYIGMIGSRRKVALIKSDFAATGIASQTELDRVFAPIGLEIGAVTVPEIATSIAAQLIAVRRNTVATTTPAKAPSP